MTKMTRDEREAEAQRRYQAERKKKQDYEDMLVALPMQPLDLDLYSSQHYSDHYRRYDTRYNIGFTQLYEKPRLVGSWGTYWQEEDFHAIPDRPATRPYARDHSSWGNSGLHVSMYEYAAENAFGASDLENKTLKGFKNQALAGSYKSLTWADEQGRISRRYALMDYNVDAAALYSYCYEADMDMYRFPTNYLDIKNYVASMGPQIAQTIAPIKDQVGYFPKLIDETFVDGVRRHMHIESREPGRSLDRFYDAEGQLHCDDGPAEVIRHSRGVQVSYYKNGQPHCVTGPWQRGPAEGEGLIQSAFKRFAGRDDGQRYAINGVFMNREEYYSHPDVIAARTPVDIDAHVAENVKRLRAHASTPKEPAPAVTAGSRFVVEEAAAPATAAPAAAAVVKRQAPPI